MRMSLPLLLSGIAGFVDAFGFLALHGLFTAHVTGNFVTLGAALVLGSQGVLSKLLALPVFAAGVAAARLAGRALGHKPKLRLLLMLGAECLLLGIAAALIVVFGVPQQGDSTLEIVVGMAMVVAMAAQNALQRVHLAYSPATTMMTGNTTQAVLDFTDIVSLGHASPPEAQQRFARTAGVIAAFACGCAAGALLYAGTGRYALLLAPAMAVAALVLALRTPPSD